jgi:hypothetical protein
MVVTHTYKHITLRVQGAHIGCLAGRLGSGTAVTAVAFFPVAEDGLDNTFSDWHSKFSLMQRISMI